MASKPFSTYPEDRAKMLDLARKCEQSDDNDAVILGDMVRAILEDEAVAPVWTLTEQLDQLLTAHRLSSVSLTRIACDGDPFWAINAQGDGHCGSNGYERGETPTQGLERAIAHLNTLRTAAVIVPELELAA